MMFEHLAMNLVLYNSNFKRDKLWSKPIFKEEEVWIPMKKTMGLLNSNTLGLMKTLIWNY